MIGSGDVPMKRAAVLLTVLLFACTSSDPYPQRDWERPRQPRGDRSAMAVLDMMPPPGWWHDYRIADPLNLSYEQKQQLDQIAADQGQQDIERLERDTTVAVRDLRTLLDSDKPPSDEIIAAGERLRSLRDNIIDRQVKLLAAERQVLTREQWQKLQDVLREERMPRNRMNDGYPRRGRIGGRGPGRMPGWPY